MKKIIITAISAFAVIASVIGCQIYDSQTNEILASGMGRNGKDTFKLQDVTADFNKLCMKFMDNSSDTASYDAIVETYMSYDKFCKAATALVYKNITNMASSAATKEQKNEYKHDDEYILNNYKEKYMTVSLLYKTYYKYISEEYGKTNPVPPEPPKYTYNKKKYDKPTAPKAPKVSEKNTESQNNALIDAYKTDYANYTTNLTRYKASKEYTDYLTEKSEYNDKVAKYAGSYSDFTMIPVIADKANPDETSYSILDLYADVNKLIWDYNSKK